MRRFKCISLETDPTLVDEWQSGFLIGNIYFESELERDEDVEENILYLLGQDGLSWYCDPACFVQVVDEELPTPDPVNPQHYKNGEVECIEGIRSAVVGKDGFAGYLTGNVIKYIWRYESKGGVQDLEKASWYLNKLVEYEKGKVK